MIYREAGQFKTSYRADQAVFPILQDRVGMALIVAAAFVAVPLFASEYLRLRDPQRAWRSALAGLKGTGLGMLAELGLALLASGLWLGAVLGGV